MHCTRTRSLEPSSGASPSTISPVRKRARERAAAPPRRRRRRPGPSGRGSGRWSGAPARGPRTGAPSSPTTGASSRRSEKQRSASAATTRRAAARDAAILPAARSWSAPARRTWSRGDRTGGARCTGHDPVARRGLRRCAPARARRRCRPSNAGTLTTTSGPGGASRVSSARNSASRRADHFEVAERVAEGPQHARGRRRIVEAGRARSPRAPARSRRCRARTRRPRASPSGDSRYSGSVLLSTSAPRWKSRCAELVAERARPRAAARPRAW